MQRSGAKVAAAANAAEEGPGADAGGVRPIAEPVGGGRGAEVEFGGLAGLVGLGAAYGDCGAAVVVDRQVAGPQGGQFGDAEERIGYDGDDGRVANAREAAVGVGLAPAPSEPGATKAGERGFGAAQVKR